MKLIHTKTFGDAFISEPTLIVVPNGFIIDVNV